MALPKNIRLNLVDYAPTEVLTAKATDKRAFVSRLAEMALFLKRREIVRGIGPDGKKFKPRKRPRADGANGAALSPHGMASRTAALLAAHEALDFVTLFWRAQGRKSWRTILAYHAQGLVRGAPVRDEFGLSGKTQKQIKADMALWWRTRKRTKAAKPKPPAPPAVLPPAAPVPKPAPRPRKVAKPPAPEPIQPTITSRGRVVYLQPGQKPDPLSKKIQVFTTPARKPRTPPPPTGPAPVAAPRKPAPRPAPAFAPQPAIGLSPARKPPKLQTAGPGIATPQLPMQPAVAPSAAPTAPILPGRPIAARIAAWDEGQAKIRQLASLGSDLAATRQAETTQRARLEELTVAYKTAARGAAKKVAKTAMEQAEAELIRLTGAVNRAQKQAREAAQSILDAPRRMRLGLTEASPDRLSEYQFDAVREGTRWLQRTIAHPEGTPLVELDIHPLPDSLTHRSFCDDRTINLTPSINASTVIHETGHHFDYHLPGFDAVAREFLAYRVGNEEAVQLRTVLKVKGAYLKHEYGKKDRFDEAFGDSAYYAGKAYDDGMTEITSMGIEKMFNDPVGFAQRDPEYATLVLGLMHGNLR